MTEATELGTMPLERLEREITELAAHINAATCSWLLLVGEFDRREGWAEWGCKSCAHWLSYRCGLSPTAGREQVRVARLLHGLPAIRARFASGELSYSQVRALTRVATAETEQDLLMIARHATAAQLDVIVGAYRGVLSYELGADEPGVERRFVRCDHDEDGSLMIQARLPAEEGALVMAALEAGRDALREGTAPDPKDARGSHAEAGEGSAPAEATHIGDSRAGGLERRDGDEAPSDRTPASNADALVLMAQTLLSSGPADGSAADRYQVVVHVDAATLTDGDSDGSCQLEHGTALHPETARRLACDASLVRILERDGRPLSVGRKTRSVPPALRRALQCRDRGCRFPGCTQRRYLHAHPGGSAPYSPASRGTPPSDSAMGGRTDLSNLVQLCAHHHRLLHEGGYQVKRGPRGALRFRRPDGQPVPATPPRSTGEAHELQRRNRDRGLDLTDQTCVPRIYPDKLDLHWVVDGLAEADSRLAGAMP